MPESRYYNVDPRDPEPPVVLTEYLGLKPGDRITYTGPITAPWADDHHPVITELIRFQAGETARAAVTGGQLFTSAILDDGQWEVNVDNLEKA